MIRHRRQPAQTMAIAVVSMVTMLGALSMVVDAGVYFVLKAQLQNAADAAALTAVWYDPACINANWGTAGCQATYPHLHPADCPDIPPGNVGPCSAAEDVVNANSSVALSLCSGPKLTAGAIPVNISAHPGVPPNFSNIVVPNVTPYVVTLDCQAPHWFARFVPGVNLMMDINANATAALGWRGPSGELLGDPRPVTIPPTPLIARLIL